MLKKLSFLVFLSILLFGFISSAEAATCISRKYKIKALWQWFVIDIYDRPDDSGVFSPQWERWVTYSSDGALIDEIVAWEGIRSSLQFLGFYEYSCPDPGGDDDDDDDDDDDKCNKDCCGVSCLVRCGFDLEDYSFLIPFLPSCDDEECPDLNLTIRGTLLPARRGTARISGDWCKSLDCNTSIK